MKRFYSMFSFIFVLVFFIFCTILPYPIFASTTNLNKNQAYQINAVNEIEISNISNAYFNILDKSWDGCIDYVLSYYTPYEVIDLEKEKSFFLSRIGGKNHADMIYVSKEDEDFINENYQQKNYVPVAIKLNDQTYIPACFCPYAHGYQNHYCLHFKNSKTDGTQKKDNIYQNVVFNAKQRLSLIKEKM